MIQISENKINCCGCAACEQTCPRQCISMCPDEEGFSYPVIDYGKCINCNKCKSVCPVLREDACQETVKEFPLAYGGWHKNQEVRHDSSSGGAFTLFAEGILDDAGVVFGCALDSDMNAVHTMVETKEELCKLRGSKYVQSDIGKTYIDVKNALDSGRKVLFVGTPCQAAGLYTFLGAKENKKLYIVDFICHGVPSKKLFQEYIRDIEKKQGRKVVSFRFRNKNHGWSQTGLQLGTQIKFNDNMVIRKYPAFMDHYMNAFLDDICLRPICYECKFKGTSKVFADFTIADFWGVEKVSKSLNDGKGTSLILMHNEHAMELWNTLCDKVYYEEVDFQKAIQRNQSLIHSSAMNPNRKKFFEDFNNKGFQYVNRKYMTAFKWGSHKLFKIIKKLYLRGKGNTYFEKYPGN